MYYREFQKEWFGEMSSSLNRRTRRNVPKAQPAETAPYTRIKDATTLLQNAAKHLEKAMRLLAEATLLQPGLDESLGIEAQRLIGVRAVVQLEIKSLENQRLREAN
jgi:hypothetical protein